jgi:hypothetical protein
MNVREMIEELNKIENKELPIYTHYQENTDWSAYTVWEEVNTVSTCPYIHVNGYKKPAIDIVVIED